VNEVDAVQLRPLGNTGLRVAPLAFGGNVFGWTADERTSLSMLDAFVDAGLNLIDTADTYSRWAPGHAGGESETIIGKWLAARPSARDRIVLATKVGMDMGEGRSGLSAKHIRRSVDASLTRLRTDRIDLYQSHVDDPKTPFDETLSTYAELIGAGKVRAIGASNHSAARLAQVLAVSRTRGLPRYETLQPEYNLYDRAGFEAELEPLCRGESLGVINYFGLARGFLSGKYRCDADLGKSARGSGVRRYLNARGWRILRTLDEIADARHATPAQVALAWQIARPAITAPIASATSVKQFEELASAAHLQLDTEAIAALDQVSAEG
jgi:aryl-alcohol dehydrogenase-like predicted oxidoreductase